MLNGHAGCRCCPYPPAQCSVTNPPARHVLAHSCVCRRPDSQRRARRLREVQGGRPSWAPQALFLHEVEKPASSGGEGSAGGQKFSSLAAVALTLRTNNHTQMEHQSVWLLAVHLCSCTLTVHAHTRKGRTVHLTECSKRLTCCAVRAKGGSGPSGPS